jgi:regulator of sirC expression with transglutaminase-like and TPR domain
MDRRLGNPISLCTIYLAVARRLRLPVTGIGLPGHFLCRCQTAQREIYVDAFNRGRLLAQADCAQFLRKQGVEFHEAHLAPVMPRRMLLRMCHNLHQIYASHGLAEDTARLQRYIVALAK